MHRSEGRAVGVVRECDSEQEGGQLPSGLGGSSIKVSDDQSIHRPFSIPMAIGLGCGGEQEVHVVIEQPRWRSPDSKIGRARTAFFILFCVVFMSVHLTLSKAALGDGEGTLFRTVSIAHNPQTCFQLHGV